MKIFSALILLTMLALSPQVAGATVREISAAELRKVVSSGQVISLKRAIDAVAKATGGEPVEARAFQGEDLLYRIVVKKPNGSLVSVIINARTGDQVAKTSSLGKAVVAAAGTPAGKANPANPANKGKSQTAGSNGNGNAGGNSGGNSGGNGGGNSGGNSGGNGGGNSGGNGGGNGGKKN